MRKSILGILVLLGIVVILISIAWVWIPVSFENDYEFTLGYVCFQIIVGGFVVGVLWLRKGWSSHTNTAASILTIVGVLGTFIGIYIGLREFDPDPEKLQGSIEVLLNGLKIAFGTSIVGIVSALLLKGIISPLVQTLEKKEDQDPVEEVINKFVLALKGVETPRENNLSLKLDDLTKVIKAESETTRNVLQGMMGTVDGVPVSFGNLHTLITDGQSKTATQLETLTETVSNKNDLILASITDGQNKTATQLEILTETVADKNDLILASQKDEATETRKTLTGMQSELTDRQNKAFIQLRELTKTVSSEHRQLRKEFENFSKNVAESITELATKELISSLTKVIDQFNTQLSTQFGDNFKQLNEAVGKTVKWQEQYRQQMDELADEFRIAAESIEKSRDSLITIADKSGSIVTIATDLEPILHTLNDQLGAFSDLRQKADDAFPLIEKRLDALTTEFSGVVQKAITDSEAQSTQLANQFNQFKGVIDGLDDFTSKISDVTTDVSNIVRDTQSSIQLQTDALRNSASYVTTMQEKLDEQLTESISKLGTNLAALSDQFAEDYKPLTQSLRNVLTIAEGILPRQLGN